MEEKKMTFIVTFDEDGNFKIHRDIVNMKTYEVIGILDLIKAGAIQRQLAAELLPKKESDKVIGNEPKPPKQ
jgi:hypothetical protein